MKKKPKRKPIQVYIDYETDAGLSLVADRMNISKAEVIRRGLEEYLPRAIPPEKDPLMEMIEQLPGEPGHEVPMDGAENHDFYLAKWEREGWDK